MGPFAEILGCGDSPQILCHMQPRDIFASQRDDVIYMMLNAGKHRERLGPAVDAADGLMVSPLRQPLHPGHLARRRCRRTSFGVSRSPRFAIFALVSLLDFTPVFRNSKTALFPMEAPDTLRMSGGPIRSIVPVILTTNTLQGGLIIGAVSTKVRRGLSRLSLALRWRVLLVARLLCRVGVDDSPCVVRARLNAMR